MPVIMLQLLGGCAALFEGDLAGVEAPGAPDPGEGQLEAVFVGVVEEFGGRDVGPAGVAGGDAAVALGIEFAEADGESFGDRGDAFFEDAAEIALVGVVVEREKVAGGIEAIGPAAHPAGGHAADGELGFGGGVDGLASAAEAVGHFGERELVDIGDGGAADAGGLGEPVVAAAHDHFGFVDELVADDAGMVGDQGPEGGEDVADQGFEKIGMVEHAAVALLDEARVRDGLGAEGEGVIKEDEEDRKAVAGGGVEGGAEGGSDAGFQAGGAFADEADAVAAVGENEPAEDADAVGGEAGKIGVEEGRAVRGFEAKGGAGGGAEVPTVVEAEVDADLERRTLGDTLAHVQ